MSRKRKSRTADDDFEVRCPNCHAPMNGQFDTEEEEPIWWCEECDQTFQIDGFTPTFYMTNVPENEEALKEAGWTEVPS